MILTQAGPKAPWFTITLHETNMTSENWRFEVWRWLISLKKMVPFKVHIVNFRVKGIPP